MFCETMKKYKEKGTGRRVVEVDDLSFLRERNHPYGWLKRHYLHKRCKRAVKKADLVLARDSVVAKEISMYYFTPKSKIRILGKKEN